MLLASVTVGGARLWYARAAIDHAAAAGARAASLARDRTMAVADGTSAAVAHLTGAGVGCAGPAVEIDTRLFAPDAGTPAAVTATVTCPISLGDLTIPGWPAAITLSAAATSPVDRYRERA